MPCKLIVIHKVEPINNYCCDSDKGGHAHDGYLAFSLPARVEELLFRLTAIAIKTVTGGFQVMLHFDVFLSAKNVTMYVKRITFTHFL